MTARDRFQNSDPDSWCWHPVHWEDAGEGSIRPAATTTRGQAGAFFARQIGDDLREVRVWKRYARPLSDLEVWQEHGGDEAWEDNIFPEQYAKAHDGRGPDDDGVPTPDPPSEPPDSWAPHEYLPAWEFIHRSHPEAIPIWVCGVRDDQPPENPLQKQEEGTE